MATLHPLGNHWAVIQTERTPRPSDAWVARWALYPTEAAAKASADSEPKSADVSGTTAPASSERLAWERGVLDAGRTEAVLSGTYRQRITKGADQSGSASLG